MFLGPLSTRPAVDSHTAGIEIATEIGKRHSRDQHVAIRAQRQRGFRAASQTDILERRHAALGNQARLLPPASVDLRKHVYRGLRKLRRGLSGGEGRERVAVLRDRGGDTETAIVVQSPGLEVADRVGHETGDGNRSRCAASREIAGPHLVPRLLPVEQVRGNGACQMRSPRHRLAELHVRRAVVRFEHELVVVGAWNDFPVEVESLDVRSDRDLRRGGRGCQRCNGRQRQQRSDRRRNQETCTYGEALIGHVHVSVKPDGAGGWQ